MKLLKSEEITMEEGEVKVVLHPITTSIQAALMSLNGFDAESKIKMAQWALRNMFISVVIEGVEYNPTDLASRADLKDKATIRYMVALGGLAQNAAFVDPEVPKK